MWLWPPFMLQFSIFLLLPTLPSSLYPFHLLSSWNKIPPSSHPHIFLSLCPQGEFIMDRKLYFIVFIHLGMSLFTLSLVGEHTAMPNSIFAMISTKTVFVALALQINLHGNIFKFSLFLSTCNRILVYPTILSIVVQSVHPNTMKSGMVILQFCFEV